MKKLFWLLTVIFLVFLDRAEAQRPRRPAIGIFELASPSGAGGGHKAFQQHLRDLRYVEGKTAFFEYRYADGKLELPPELVADLVRSHVDVIVTRSTAAIRAAQNATKTIPIVFRSRRRSHMQTQRNCFRREMSRRRPSPRPVYE